MNLSIKSKSAVIYMMYSVLGLFVIINSVYFSKNISTEIYKSIERCISTIIPSLFFMMCISDILIKSGVYKALAKPLSYISRYVFRLKPELFIIFIFSNFAGYPVGIKLLTQLVEEKTIDKSYAEILSQSCYAPSPSFIIGVVGVSVFNSSDIGMIIYASIFLANTIILFLIGTFRPIPQKDKTSYDIKINSDIIVDSVDNASKALFKMCAVVLFISALTSIIDSMNLFRYLSLIIKTDVNLIKSFFEISFLSYINRDYNLLSFISAIFSFGGICVIVQIKSIVGKRISLLRFILSRIPVFLLTYLISKGLFSIIEINSVAIEVSTQVHLVKSNNYLTPICVFFMIIIFFLKKPLVNLQKT